MLVTALKALLEGFFLRSFDERPVGLRQLSDLDEEDALSAIARPITAIAQNPFTASVNRMTQQALKQPIPAFSRTPHYTYSYRNVKPSQLF